MDLSFVADENIEKHVVEKLQRKGFRVTYVAEINPGVRDEEVLRMANKTGSILMTSDKDFGEIVFRQRKVTTGVVLLRLYSKSSKEKAEIVLDALEKHSENLKDAFTVITEVGVRVRKNL